MTPRELNIYIQEYNARKQQEAEEAIITAYLTAYYARVKRMPSLNDILNKLRPSKPKSDEDLLAQIKAINAALGGEIVVREQK